MHNRRSDALALWAGACRSTFPDSTVRRVWATIPGSMCSFKKSRPTSQYVSTVLTVQDDPHAFDYGGLVFWVCQEKRIEH